MWYPRRNPSPPRLILNNEPDSWKTGCGSQRGPKVRQKSKSNGASPQRYPTPGQFHDEFINIVTSCENVDFPPPSDEFGEIDAGFLGIWSQRSSRSGSNASYGSSKLLLQVPSTSTLYQSGMGEEDWADSNHGSRTQRSSSITVPIQRRDSFVSGVTLVRRCSSASPKRRFKEETKRDYKVSL
jgi:hypothetical protein